MRLHYNFVSFEIGTKNRKLLLTKLLFFKKIAGTLLLSSYLLKCTPLLKELRQNFFELGIQHRTIKDNPLR